MSYQLISLTDNQQIKEKAKNSNHLACLPMKVVYDYQKLKKIFSSPTFRRIPPTAIKYKRLYPVNQADELITLKEGGTPLYQSQKTAKKLGLENLYFKHEGFNPTGAFKDRGSLVEISKARKYRAKAVVVASTGNMAASVSAYCAKANLPCFVFVPQHTPKAKLAQILFFGAKIIKVRSNYDQAAALAQKTAEEFNLYLTGDYAFRTEGQKSQAYEIVEQLGFKAPDYVLAPVGNGTNIFAIWKGFDEYKKMGLVEKAPKMIAVQISAYQPVVKAHQKGLTKITPLKKDKGPRKTIASAIAVKDPMDGNKVLSLLSQSGGTAVAVTDKQALKAQFQLAFDESLFVEPSSATVVAGLKKLISKNKIAPGATVVCLLTGHGLKDPLPVNKPNYQSLVVEPVFSQVKKLFEKKIWKR